MNDVVKKKTKKIILIILIVIASIVILGTIFGIVDYFRARSGKKPIFIYHTVNVTSFDVMVEGFEDTASSNIKSAEYYGIGYKITTCDIETKNYTFHLGHKQKNRCLTTLTCTKTLAENDRQSIDYTFYDGKLVRIFTTLTIPVDQIKDKETYKNEFMKINDINSCGGIFKKLNETTYLTSQGCNISKMSNSDVEKIYSTSKKSLEQTRNEIIDSYSNDKDMVCE